MTQEEAREQIEKRLFEFASNLPDDSEYNVTTLEQKDVMVKVSKTDMVMWARDLINGRFDSIDMSNNISYIFHYANEIYNQIIQERGR
jgi:hypothetical protein